MKTLPHGTLFIDTLVDINNLVLSIGNQLNIDTTKLELFGTRAEAVKIVRTTHDNLVKINESLKERK